MWYSLQIVARGGVKCNGRKSTGCLQQGANNNAINAVCSSAARFARNIMVLVACAVCCAGWDFIAPVASIEATVKIYCTTPRRRQIHTQQIQHPLNYYNYMKISTKHLQQLFSFSTFPRSKIVFSKINSSKSSYNKRTLKTTFFQNSKNNLRICFSSREGWGLGKIRDYPR